MFYAMGFLLSGSSGHPVNQNEKVPESRDYHRRLWAGEVNLADHQSKVTYGLVHLQQLLRNTRQPYLNEALKVVSDRHP
jgi:hypothetical protein